MGPVSRSRAARLAGFALLVAVGSSLGTLARASIELAVPTPPGAWPWATFGINLVGSLLLGLLLEVLSRTGEDRGWRRTVRLGVGTGVIGGFTTYSTLIVEIDQLVRFGGGAVAASYALTSILLGLVAAGAGMALGALVLRRPMAASAPTPEGGS